MGRRYEPWSRQPLVQGYMEIPASSCYQLLNGESVRHPQCSQLDVYTSTLLGVVSVELSSEDPESYALLGVLAQDYTCGALDNNSINGEERDLSMTLFPLKVSCDLEM